MEGWGGAWGTTYCQVTAISIAAFVTDLGAGGWASMSHSTSHVSTTHMSGPPWGELLEEQISKVGPAKPPLLCMGSCPSLRASLWGGGRGCPGAPSLPVSQDTHSPSLRSRPLSKMAEGARGHVRGLGVPLSRWSAGPFFSML